MTNIARPAPDLGDPVDLSDFEVWAKTLIAPMAWDFIIGGAADEITLRWNRESYDRIRLWPRVLVDVSRIDTRVTLLGRELPFPILLAPTSYHRLIHPEGELATVRGAGAARATLIVSSFASVRLEEVAAAATQPLWFQLYVQPDRGFTRELVQRAEAAGYQALVLTVDTPILGARYREMRARFAVPPGIECANFVGRPAALHSHPSVENSSFRPTLDPTLVWKDLEWLRSLTRLPVLLKGVLHPDDADRAAQTGVAGIIVSNHGARNLDTAPATIDALPAVAERVAGRMPVLIDGGIRRGTDALKALALGASAVLIGRPYLFGLAAGGEAGVARVVNLLRRELEMAMALTGRTSVAAIDSSVIASS